MLLTTNQQANLQEAMSNPTGCVAHAWFYAFMNGQKTTADLLQSKFDEITDLVLSLGESGTISRDLVKEGPCAAGVQKFLDTTTLEDVRIARLRALTSLRFQVTTQKTPPTLN